MFRRGQQKASGSVPAGSGAAGASALQASLQSSTSERSLALTQQSDDSSFKKQTWTDEEREEYVATLEEVGIGEESVAKFLCDSLALAPVPPPWTMCRDNESKAFFFNQATGESSWSHPLENAVSQLASICRVCLALAPQLRAPCIQSLLERWEQDAKEEFNQWYAVPHVSGKDYYCHQITGETTWDHPATIVLPSHYVKMQSLKKLLDENYVQMLQSLAGHQESFISDTSNVALSKGDAKEALQDLDGRTIMNQTAEWGSIQDVSHVHKDNSRTLDGSSRIDAQSSHMDIESEYSQPRSPVYDDRSRKEETTKLEQRLAMVEQMLRDSAVRDATRPTSSDPDAEQTKQMLEELKNKCAVLSERHDQAMAKLRDSQADAARNKQMHQELKDQCTALAQRHHESLAKMQESEAEAEKNRQIQEELKAKCAALTSSAEQDTRQDDADKNQQIQEELKAKCAALAERHDQALSKLRESEAEAEKNNQMQQELKDKCASLVERHEQSLAKMRELEQTKDLLEKELSYAKSSVDNEGDPAEHYQKELIALSEQLRHTKSELDAEHVLAEERQKQCTNLAQEKEATFQSLEAARQARADAAVQLQEFQREMDLKLEAALQATKEAQAKEADAIAREEAAAAAAAAASVMEHAIAPRALEPLKLAHAASLASQATPPLSARETMSLAAIGTMRNLVLQTAYAAASRDVMLIELSQKATHLSKVEAEHERLGRIHQEAVASARQAQEAKEVLQAKVDEYGRTLEEQQAALALAALDQMSTIQKKDEVEKQLEALKKDITVSEEETRQEMAWHLSQELVLKGALQDVAIAEDFLRQELAKAQEELKERSAREEMQAIELSRLAQQASKLKELQNETELTHAELEVLQATLEKERLRSSTTEEALAKADLEAKVRAKEVDLARAKAAESEAQLAALQKRLADAEEARMREAKVAEAAKAAELEAKAMADEAKAQELRAAEQARAIEAWAAEKAKAQEAKAAEKVKAHEEKQAEKAREAERKAAEKAAKKQSVEGQMESEPQAEEKEAIKPPMPNPHELQPVRATPPGDAQVEPLSPLSPDKSAVKTWHHVLPGQAARLLLQRIQLLKSESDSVRRHAESAERLAMEFTAVKATRAKLLSTHQAVAGFNASLLGEVMCLRSLAGVP